MPVLALIRHLTLVYTDVLSAGVAVFGVQRLVAAAAVWSTLSHDVALAAQSRLTLKTAEMLHVPVPALRLRTLVRKDDLVAGLAAGFDVLCVVPSAVDVSVLVEVNEVDQQLITGGALETLRMPAGAVTCSRSKHSNVSATDLPATLLADGSSHGDGEESDDAAAQILPLPLLAEQPQLFLLFFIQ